MQQVLFSWVPLKGCQKIGKEWFMLCEGPESTALQKADASLETSAISVYLKIEVGSSRTYSSNIYYVKDE